MCLHVFWRLWVTFPGAANKHYRDVPSPPPSKHFSLSPFFDIFLSFEMLLCTRHTELTPESFSLNVLGSKSSAL